MVIKFIAYPTSRNEDELLALAKQGNISTGTSVISTLPESLIKD